MEVVGHVDAGGTVRGGDDGGGGGVGEAEARRGRGRQGEEDAELRRRAEEKHLRVGEQGAEVDHRPDADEEQERKELACDTGVEKGFDGLGAGKGEVHENGPEAHGEQERGLHLPLDRQVDEKAAGEDHQHLLPGEIEDIGEEIVEQLHGSCLLKSDSGNKKRDFHGAKTPQKSRHFRQQRAARPY